jgi:small subunit ribosomal protein S27Ae
MHIQVKTLTGKSLSLNVEPNIEISELNSQIESSMGVPSEDQILISNGKTLKGNLIDYELTEESEIYMVIDIDGGKKKKKKKVVNKKKKKHTKKKVKLAVLKYYKVDGDKVIRLKQQTNYGTFLADHANRLYCGRTHITYVKAADKKGGDAKAAKGGKKK